MAQSRPIYYDAVIDMLPLSIAVIPWGILCGSLAIGVGFTPLQSQCMSLFVFAGAAQLSGVSIIGAAGSLPSLLGSTAVISSRHILYSATFRDDVKDLPLSKRVPIAFLLTDEMFAVTQAYRRKSNEFVASYAITSGFVFYLIWNVATFVGIYAGQLISNLDELGLEFAIAATFIAIVVPEVKSIPILIAATISGVSAVTMHYLKIDNAILISALIGMVIGYVIDKENFKHG